MYEQTIFFLVSTQIIGIVAGIFTSLSLLPQVFKIIKEKEADELSLAWLLILFVGLGLWTYYGVLKEDLPIIITNSFSLLVNLALIILKVKYK